MYGALQAERPGNECTECGKDRTGCKCMCVLYCGGNKMAEGDWRKLLMVSGEREEIKAQGQV